MAYKIVNGKLVLITSQSDFGTPAQKAAGQKVTGTLGNITKSTAPKQTSTPQKITYGPGPIVPAPPPEVPTMPPIKSYGPEARELFQSGELSAPTALTQSLTDLSRTQKEVFSTKASASQPSALTQHLQNVQAQFGSAPTGTLGLGINREAASRVTLGTGERIGQAGDIVTGGDIRLQNYYKTLNNPRTLGEFEALGSGPKLQAMLRAFENGENIDPVFLRFFWNQGLLEETAPNQFALTSAGQSAASGGSTRTGGGGVGGGFTNSRFANSGLGLTNWRI